MKRAFGGHAMRGDCRMAKCSSQPQLPSIYRRRRDVVPRNGLEISRSHNARRTRFCRHHRAHDDAGRQCARCCRAARPYRRVAALLFAPARLARRRRPPAKFPRQAKLTTHDQRSARNADANVIKARPPAESLMPAPS